MRTLVTLVAALVISASIKPNPVFAQQPAPQQPQPPAAGKPSSAAADLSTQRAMASRSELEGLLKSGSMSNDEAAVVRERLQNGDFAAGDRLVLRVLEEPTLNDTFAVRTGQVLVLPNFPEISMKGVLRSEAQAYLATQIAQFIRNPTVQVEPMIRVSLLGAVNRPGFYSLRADMLASEALMAGGGPAGNADVHKTVIRRNGSEIRNRQQVQGAFSRGVSLDELNLQAGDEIFVGEKSGGAKQAIILAGAISGSILALIALKSKF